MKSKHLAAFYTIFITCYTLLSKIGISIDSLRTRAQEFNMASPEAAISDSRAFKIDLSEKWMHDWAKE